MIGGSKSSKLHILVEFQNFGTENIDWGSKSPKCHFFYNWNWFWHHIYEMTYSVWISAISDIKPLIWASKISKMSFIDIRKWLRLQISEITHWSWLSGLKSKKRHVLVQFWHFRTENNDWGSKSPKCLLLTFRDDWSSKSPKWHILIQFWAIRDKKRWLRLQISKMSFIGIRK